MVVLNEIAVHTRRPESKAVGSVHSEEATIGCVVKRNPLLEWVGHTE